jgi:CheY-like chemotaxis protein
MRATHLPNPHKLRALLVYANRQTADTLAELFAACGQEVLVANGEATACELAWKHRPEVVFWDLRVYGDEVRRLAFRDAAVVAITSAGREPTLQPAEGGFMHYLVEPIDPIQVQALLKKLERRASDSRAGDA